MRPFIMLHMLTSKDGAGAGDFLKDPEIRPFEELYYKKHSELNENGFICGRKTMEESFTRGFKPDLSSFAGAEISRKDFLPYIEGSEYPKRYAVAFDSHGKLGWKSNRIKDEDPGYDGHIVFEVLSEDVPDAYLAYLQSLKIPYVFAGKTEIDLDTALEKLARHGMDFLLLEGGPTLNGSFAKKGLIDAISLVISDKPASGNHQHYLNNEKRPKMILCKQESGQSWRLYSKSSGWKHLLLSLDALEEALSLSGIGDPVYDLHNHEVTFITGDFFESSDDPLFDEIRDYIRVKFADQPDNEEWIEEASDGDLLNACDWVISLNDLPGSKDGYGIMEGFTETLGNSSSACRLERALSKRKPFRNFKDEINRLGLSEEWYDYKDNADRENLKKWCRENGHRWF